MIEAKNKSEFLKILSVISEEAVRLSKKNLNESADPYLEKYSEQFSNDQKMYGSLSEQDDLEPLEDEEAEEDFEEEEPADEEDIELEDEPAEDEPVEDDAAPESEDTSTEEFGVSFDSVLSAINNLRAGKSLKDTNIKDQTSAYYDRLDDPERKVLLVFLKQLSEILAGSLEGSAAQDPSDMNLTITDGSAEDADADEEGEEPADDGGEEEVISDEETEEDFEEEEPADEEDEEEAEPAEEDTSPPIKVNESQDLTELRQRIRRLMLRG